jgi:ribosomal protein S18 acetylase RimI-like enzyme
MQPDAPPIRIRLARADDDAFVLGLAERFVAFELPPWRRRGECLAGIRRELARHLAEQPPGSHLFVAEDEDGTRVGFVHLQLTVDTLTGAANAHICDLAVAPGLDRRGIGSRLLAEAEAWARRRRCRHLTLAVFPGNEAARSLYERRGFGVELLRMVKPL